MQGQRSAIGSLPDSINFDCGSAPTNVGIEQQICWNSLEAHPEDRLPDNRVAPGGSGSLMGTISREGQTLSRWNIGEPSSSSNLPTLSNHEERTMIQNAWSSSMSSSSLDPGSRLLEDPLYEPSSGISRDCVNLNLSTNQLPNGPSFIKSSHAGSASQNLDINAGFLGRVGPSADLMEYSSSLKSSRLEHRLNPSSSGPPEPVSAFSGSGGFVVEDDDARHGCSVDGRRISCKRKALAGQSGQSSGSGNNFSREGGSIRQANPPSIYAIGGSSLNVSAPSVNPLGIGTQLVNPRLGLSLGQVPSDNSIPNRNLLGIGGSGLERRYWRRTNHINHHDFSSNDVFVPPVGEGPACLSSSHQPNRLRSVGASLDMMPELQPENASTPEGEPDVLRFPGLRRSVQTVRWSGRASSSRATGSARYHVEAGVAAGERNTSLHEDSNSEPVPRNISDHPMFTPSSEVRNTSQSPSIEWNVSSSHNGGTSRNLPSSSRTLPSFGPHPSWPSWGYHRHPSSQYSRRLSEYVRRSLTSASGSESSVQGNTGPASSSSSQEVVPPSGVHSQLFSRSALWMDRHGDGVVGNPNSLRTLAVMGEGRNRVVSEIRNVLDMMRRGEGLRVEDVLLNPSVIFGIADIHDQHRDMRLDVDNMSYEELLALEDRIGNVCTGVSEGNILTHMKQRKYTCTMREKQQKEAVQCCICQEEYKEGEELGMLDCTHDFHSECIKQWLTQKNLCPVCKTTAVAAA